MQLEDFLECIHNDTVPLESPDGLTGGGWEWDGPLDDMESFGAYLRARAVCVERGMWAIVEGYNTPAPSTSASNSDFGDDAGGFQG